MEKRITSLILAVLLLAGLVPAVLAVEEPSEPPPDTLPEGTVPEPTPPEESVLDNTSSLEQDGITTLASVPVSTDRTRQIQWVGHGNGRYNLTYKDAQGVSRGGYISSISIHRVDNKMAYCIQPAIEFGSTYTENAADAAWKTQLTSDQRTAIAAAIAYGYPNQDYPAASPPGAAGDSTLEYPLRTDLWQVSERYAATQIIVWEIVTGKREATPPYRCTDISILDAFYRKSNPYGYRADWETLKLTYESISQKLANHKTVPSFSSPDSGNAPVHELKYDSASGKYTLTLTDSNGVLSDYNFSTSISGITFSRSGNTLTISATPEATVKLTIPQLASAAGTSLNIDPDKVVTVWTATDGGQTAVQVKSNPEPVTAYFRLKAEVSGRVLLKKATNTSKNLGGWKIGLYTDSGCTKPVSGSPFTTASDGTVTVPNLTPGTYFAKEQASSDPFWVCDQEVKTVQVEAGKTATVTFTNIFRPGKISIQKVDPIGNPLAGAKFCLEWSEDGKSWETITYSNSADVVKGGCSNSQVVDGCITTGEDGVAEWGNLHPMLYYRITELEAPDGYQLLSEPAFSGKLPEDNLTISLRVVNGPGFSLPRTGCYGLSRLPLGVLLCLGICAGAVVSLKKQER